jgi:zinc transporter ZupT
MRYTFWIIPGEWVLLWWIAKGVSILCMIIAILGLLVADDLHQALMFLLAAAPGALLIYRGRRA